jgi:hypothetical protein
MPFLTKYWTERIVMFSVVGITLDDISLGSPPQVRLAEVLESRMKAAGSHYQAGEEITVYAVKATATQALVARTKYKEQGEFLLFFYFSDAAVQLCKENGIPLTILERISEADLPANREAILSAEPNATDVGRRL